MFKHQSDFLADSRIYVYNIDDLSHEEIDMNRKLISFFVGLGFVECVTDFDVASRETKEEVHKDAFAVRSRIKRG